MMQKYFFRASKFWYTYLYEDVRNSKLNSKYHFRVYGSDENRIPNIFIFLMNQSKLSFFDFIIFVCFSFLKFNILVSFFKNLIIKLEYLKIKKVHFRHILITSWIKDGVRDATYLYANKLSTDENVIILKSFKNVSGNTFAPMNLEVWASGELQKSFNLIFPISVLLLYENKCDTKLILSVHHILNNEFNVNYLLQNFKSQKLFFIHDYFIFSRFPHLYSDKFGNRSINFYNKNFPNDKINLNIFINNFDKFICPSNSVYMDVIKFISSNKLIINYHPEESNIELKNVNKLENKSNLKFLLIGNLGPYKGSKIIKNFIDYCALNKLEYIFYHVGNYPLKITSPNYVHVGYVDKKDLISKCSELNCDLAFLPLLSKETYSFTLSDIFNLNLPLICSKIEILLERCYGRSNTIFISKFNPQEIINSIKLLSALRVTKNVKFSKKIISLRERKHNYTLEI